MIRRRGNKAISRVRVELHDALAERHSPQEVAGSFALGTFITMLPTWGIGVLFFFVIVYLFDRVSKVALFASVIVFNPVVKWGVYAGSLLLGVALLGPVEGLSPADISPDVGREVLIRLLVGNLILAVLATVLAYLLVYRLAVRYRRSTIAAIMEEAIDEVGDEINPEQREEQF